MPRKAKGWRVWVERSGLNWRCRWMGRHGNDQKIFVFEDDAQEYRRAKRRDLERMDAGLPPLTAPLGAVTVAAWATTYLINAKQDKAPSTYKNFDYPAVDSFRAMHGKLALGALTDQHVRAWKAQLEEDYSGTTAAMYFRQIRAFLNAAIRAGHLTASPARHVPKPAEGRGGRALKDEELVALMHHAEPPLYRAGTFALNTCLRIDEVCRFDWAWVYELPSGVWMGRIPAELRKTRGKVKEDCLFPINPAAQAVMGPRRLAGRVFPWRPNTLQQQIVAARTAAELPDDITFHCFRHTAASRYLRETGHMEDLLKSRLWSDPRSLLRYVHVDEAMLWRRFAAVKYPRIAPIGPPKRIRRPPASGAA